ncbi:MAG: FAD-binding oxidoreductase [Vicinamibacterales bacterium]
MSKLQLNRLGIEAWHELESELGGDLPVRWGGSVEWYGEPAAAAEFRADIRRHQSWGYATHLIDQGTLTSLEPHVTPGAVTVAAHAQLEGHVDPVLATQLLLERARVAGARVLHPAEVTGLDEARGRLRAVRTSAGPVEADVLVIACGTDTPRVAAMAGIRVPLQHSPGILVHTAPMPSLLERVVLAPTGHMKQKPDGRILVGQSFGGTPGTDTSPELARQALERAADALPQLRTARVDRVTLGWRPLPIDGFPIAGFAPGRPDVYVTVMHSGVTLSPAIALFAAVEILDRVDAEPLAPYRPARFQA